jgi:hypothetical protein
MKKLANSVEKLIWQKKSILITMAISATCLFLLSSVFAEGIEVAIESSIDGGTTFKPAVEIPKGGSVIIRASWDNIRTDDSRSEWLCNIHNLETNFASANVGKQNWDGVKYIQKKLPGYFSAKLNSITMKIDLGARKDGVIGFKNKWSKKQNKYIDAPLPACSALAPGTYIFNFSIYYRKTDGTKVEGLKMFPITINKVHSKGS